MSNGEGLPKGWVDAKLRDVTLPGRTRNPQREGEGTFRYVDIEALDNTRQQITSPKLLAKSEAPSRARMSILSGDVIFSLVRPYLKNIAIVPPDLDHEIASTAYCVLRPGTDLNSKFLFHQLLQESFIHSVPTYGSSPPSARDEEFLDIPVRVAPALEQRRIVAKIEELFSDLDAGVVALQRVKAKLKRYRAAVLKAAVEGRLTKEWRKKDRPKETGRQLLDRILQERRRRWEEEQLANYEKAGTKPPAGWKDKYKDPVEPDASSLPTLPEDWCVSSLEQITSAIRVICYGILMPKENIPDGVPYVKVRDMKGDRINLATIERTSPEIAAQYLRASLTQGDLLLAIRGTYGRVAVVPPELSGGNITQDTARLAISRLVDSNYIAWFLRSTDCQNYFKRVARGVAVKGVNIGDVRPCAIPLPPIAEQRQITEEIEDRLSVVDKAEDLIAANLKRSARLRQSVLKRAFEGKLVPQDPNDEPASVLLERIKTEKLNSTEKSQQPRKQRSFQRSPRS